MGLLLPVVFVLVEILMLWSVFTARPETAGGAPGRRIEAANAGRGLRSVRWPVSGY